MRAYFRFVLRHRVLVVGICVGITLLLALALTRARLGTSLAELILGDDPAYHRYVERVQAFGSDEVLIVGVESPDLDTDPGRQRLARAVERIDAFPEVGRVHSPLSAWQILQTLQGTDVPLDPAALASEPLFQDLVISEDTRHIALVVELDPAVPRSLEKTPVFVESVTEILVSEGYDREAIHLGGIVATMAEVQRQTQKNIGRLLPLVAVIMLLLTYLLFRRLWPVVLTFVIGVIAILWTMGFAVLLNPQINVIVALAPSLILLISFSDVVHLCHGYFLTLEEESSREVALQRSAEEVGTAVLFTSITTLIGFLGLALIDVPAFRALGFILGFGVCVALLLAMTLVPIFFSWIPTPKPLPPSSRSGGIVDRGIDRFRRWSTDRPALVVSGFTLFVALCIAGILTIEVETDITRRMSPDNALRQDAAYLQEHFAGNTVLELFLTFPPGANPLDPALTRGVASFLDAVAALPEVGKAFSLSELLARFDPLKLALAMAAQSDAPLRLIDLPTRTLRIPIFLEGTGMSAAYSVGEKARDLAATHLGDSVAVEPSGFFYLGGQWLERHVVAQRRALLATFASIALILVILFRSLRVGLGSMLPNAVPLLALGGAVALFANPVDSDLVIVAVVAIGIAVDDTIHFLVRHRFEAARRTGQREALVASFAHAGRPITITSVIFAMGFVPFAISDYLPIFLIGVFLPLVMLMALLADLLLLPAMISLGWIDFPSPPTGEVRETV